MKISGMDLVARVLQLKHYMRKEMKNGPYRLKYHPSLEQLLNDLYHRKAHCHLTVRERLLLISEIKEIVPIENQVDLKPDGIILEQIEEKKAL